MTDPDQDSEATSESAQGPPPRSRWTWLGFALIVLSGVLWFSLFAIPFLPVTTGQKAAIGGGLFAAVQIAWWSGAALAGPRTMKSLSQRFGRSR